MGSHHKVCRDGERVANESFTQADLQSRCDVLRSLHRPGDPLLLPNAWDVATARAVVAAGFPVVATTSWAVAATLATTTRSVHRPMRCSARPRGSPRA
jgi:hypothetical protein